MKFFCLCMSPAIDALVKLPTAPRGTGEIFKNVADEENVGGKAINVARWLAIRGAEVSCGGLLGEDNATIFMKELAKYGIEDNFLRVHGSTRRNEVISWPGGSFKINRVAFPQLQDKDCLGIKYMRGFNQLSEGDVVIMSGSLPQNCSQCSYFNSILSIRRLCNGVKIVLDTSGEALKNGIEAHPDLIKPNAEECEPLVGFVPKTPYEFRRATEILHCKCAHVIISDGAAGAWFDGVFQPAPKVDVVDTTAAGDTLLAEWCFSHDFYLAVAAGSAACTMSGSRTPSVEVVKNLAQQLKE